jgi:hypothetical protein
MHYRTGEKGPRVRPDGTLRFSGRDGKLRVVAHRTAFGDG